MRFLFLRKRYFDIAFQFCLMIVGYVVQILVYHDQYIVG